MPLRDMLVHVKLHEDWSPHIDYALKLAAQHGARLTGLVTLRDLSILKSIGGVSASMLKEREQKDYAVVSRLEEQFRAAAQKSGVTVHWDVAEGHASEALAWATRYHDIAVLEQTRWLDEIEWSAAEEVVVAAGGGAIIVPPEGHERTPGHVVIAWNGSREATRAVRAAMPLIEAAGRVTILVGASRPRFPSITRAPSGTIETYLRAHAANVEVKPFETTDSEAGKALMSMTEELNGDLLVMGAYGRSWLRETILGGATTQVLSDIGRPVLMAR
jgi:nucleotide-binding universal stress UspA family protein